MSCLFLSRTFHEEENIDEVIVPLPSFEASTRRPLTKGSQMSLIYKYSPFRTEEEFFAQFERIEGNSGTLVVIYNLKLLDDSHTELDITTDPTDILLANPASDYDSDEGLMPERRSFRAYASILYMDPRMRIYIQNKKVHTKRLASCLYRPRLYKYSSNRFKTRTENEAKRAHDEALAADNKAKEAESKARNLEAKYGSSLNKDQRAELRKAQTTAAEYRRDAEIKKQIADRKGRALKDPKTLNLIFGINLENRAHDGVFVYNCSRLIKMYEKVGPQVEGGVYSCLADTVILQAPMFVSGIVDVPYLVLEPTHNKQDFADAKEYRHLMKAMAEHMIQYWKDVAISQASYGYTSDKWRDPPSSDAKFIRKRAMQISKTLQCDLCLKWRMLPFLSSSVNTEFPDNWQCSMNPDQQHNRCTTAEQKLNIPEGILKKEGKSQEQKKKDLEEEIKKKQEILEKCSKEVQEIPKKKEEPISPKLSKPSLNTPSHAKVSRRQSIPPPPPKRKPSPPPPPPAPRHRALSTPAPKATHSPARSAPPMVQKSMSVAKSTSRTVSKLEIKASPSSRIVQNRAPGNKKEEFIRRSPSPALSSSRKRPVSVATHQESLRRPGKAVGAQTSDDGEDEEEEEEVMAPLPVKKSKTTTLAAEGKEMVETPTQKKPPPGVFQSSTEENEASQSGMEAMDIDTNSNSGDVMGEVVINDADSNGEIGTRVEALINGKWHAGVVVRVNPAEAKWKVKFDHYPKDKYDKWYDKKSSDIRVLKTGPPSSDTPASPESQAQETAELPRLPLPRPPAPSTPTISPTVTALRKQEAETAKAKLASVRKLIAKLLKSTNEEFDIDPEADGDQVDELLTMCVRQAVQSQT
ncbi:hypothetical protein C0Q70_08167 [Pomacea canaliculata]|uniref:CW-type domain-containing protein n=1 Tax=Pomacea canaliculata TaxID=400727 RepID=A0A2T7PH24_POMCA|nr:hypothetical protein C0Q70_08167 [Pomacea canaliculata]